MFYEVLILTRCYGWEDLWYSEIYRLIRSFKFLSSTKIDVSIPEWAWVPAKLSLEDVPDRAPFDIVLLFSVKFTGELMLLKRVAGSWVVEFSQGGSWITFATCEPWGETRPYLLLTSVICYRTKCLYDLCDLVSLFGDVYLRCHPDTRIVDLVQEVDCFWRKIRSWNRWHAKTTIVLRRTTHEED